MNKADIRNIYCDESCHLRSQHGPMVLGAIMAKKSRVRVHRDNLRRIKAKYGIKPYCEMKWTGVSPSRLDVYKEMIDYFFAQDDLRFRALVVPDKDTLNHKAFHQTYDEWYYKMYFDMLNQIISDEFKNRIYLDLKDTRGCSKVNKLHDILCTNEVDFQRELIERVQEIRSHEVALMSLLDVMIGLVAYKARKITTSSAKREMVRYMQLKSGLSLEKSTYLSAQKVNIFYWRKQEVPNV